MREKIMIAMSGGVDSSVATLLLKQSGYEIIGVTFDLNPYKNLSKSDIDDAKKVAQKMNFPHYMYDFKEEFNEKVIEKFAKDYVQGLTPNPCIECNRCIKFKKLLEKSKEFECSKIATGHYANVEYDSQKNRYILKKGKDIKKDQSYVLYTLTQEELSKLVLPLGKYTKEEIREIAVKNEFVNANKPDSQDICFIKDGDYVKFLKEQKNINVKSGNFVNSNGEILGKHKGIINYTIGQRKGMGISSTFPYYVIKKDIIKNEIVLGSKEELYKESLIVKDVNLISIEKLESPIKVNCKIRYSQKESRATLKPLENGEIKVIFDEPQKAIAKGQSAVFYDEDIVIGGGIIK